VLRAGEEDRGAPPDAGGWENIYTVYVRDEAGNILSRGFTIVVEAGVELKLR